MSYRTGIVVVCVVVAGFFAFRWLEAAEEPAANRDSAATLQELLERVKKLESRVDQLESRPGTLVSPGGNIRWMVPKSPLMTVPEATLPEGWLRREFNGVPYYVVPLESSAGAEPSHTTVPAAPSALPAR